MVEGGVGEGGVSATVPEAKPFTISASITGSNAQLIRV